MKKEIVGDDEILKSVNDIGEEERTINDLIKIYPGKIGKVEETLINYISQNDPKFLKTEFPDKRNYLSEKLAYPHWCFNSINDYQNPVNKLKKEDFCSK